MQTLLNGVRGLFSAVSWLVTATFSPLLLLAGYIFGQVWTNELLQVVGTPAPSGIAWPMVALIVLGIVGMGPEVVFLTDSSSPKRALQWNSVIDTTAAVVISTIGGGLALKGVLPWWYLPGWAFSLINMYSSSWFGMNNLFQKNPTQMQKGE